MESVRCPICEQWIRAENNGQLSEGLRSHLSSQHDIEVQRSSGRFTAPMTSAEERSGRVIVNEPRNATGVRGAEHRREEQTWAPEQGTEVPPRPQGLSDWVRKSVGMNEEAGGREEWTQGEGYPTMMQRSSRSRTTEVECPMCGRTITGRGDDDLSDELEEHFRTAHRIVPRVTER